MRILKSYGDNGGLLVSAAFVPEDFDKKKPVFISFDDVPVPFFIEQIKPHGSSKFFIKLEDIDSIEDAEELVGKDFIFKNEDADTPDAIIGYTLVDSITGTIVGKISGFVDIPGNPCLEVEKNLFPCHDDLIHKIDNKKRIIHLAIPAGLLS